MSISTLAKASFTCLSLSLSLYTPRSFVSTYLPLSSLFFFFCTIPLPNLARNWNHIIKIFDVSLNRYDYMYKDAPVGFSAGAIFRFTYIPRCASRQLFSLVLVSSLRRDALSERLIAILTRRKSLCTRYQSSNRKRRTPSGNYDGEGIVSNDGTLYLHSDANSKIPEARRTFTCA